MSYFKKNSVPSHLNVNSGVNFLPNAFSKFLFMGFILALLGLTGCQSKPTPESVAKDFWQAIQNNDLETAKQWVSWDSVDYLKYFADRRLKLKHFECAEMQQESDTVYRVNTLLVIDSGRQSDISIPAETVVVKSGENYRIDLKRTLSKVLSRTLNEASNQINQMFKQGLERFNQEWGSSLNGLVDSMDDIANTLKDSLEQGAEDLNESLQELEKQLEQPRTPRAPMPKPDADEQLI